MVMTLSETVNKYSILKKKYLLYFDSWYVLVKGLDKKNTIIFLIHPQVLQMQ